jgi:hypothetical protein
MVAVLWNFSGKIHGRLATLRGETRGEMGRDSWGIYRNKRRRI